MKIILLINITQKRSLYRHSKKVVLTQITQNQMVHSELVQERKQTKHQFRSV